MEGKDDTVFVDHSREELAQPIDSWKKEDFIKYAREQYLSTIRKYAPVIIENKDHNSIVAHNWIKSAIREIYRLVRGAKFTLEELGTNETELKEAIAPSKIMLDGQKVTQTETEREEIWGGVLEGI